MAAHSQEPTEPRDPSPGKRKRRREREAPGTGHLSTVQARQWELLTQIWALSTGARDPGGGTEGQESRGKSEGPLLERAVATTHLPWGQ